MLPLAESSYRPEADAWIGPLAKDLQLRNLRCPYEEQVILLLVGGVSAEH